MVALVLFTSQSLQFSLLLFMALSGSEILPKGHPIQLYIYVNLNVINVLQVTCEAWLYAFPVWVLTVYQNSI